ncbi:hypothetical protein [Streptomyces prunicolor]|uniref:hypothetical protein n=1 Tax=Streptomyces prunicolor TaxID=67348 RepID=UPI003405A8CD
MLDLMGDEQVRLLARLSEVYADALPEIRDRTPQASVAVLLYAVHAHQAQRVLAGDVRWRETAGITEVPEDRPEDVAAALALLQVARAELEGLEGALCWPPARPAPARANHC